MPYMVEPRVKEAVLAKIEEQRLRPTELLDLLQKSYSYREIQDALGALLESGEVELGDDRRLKAKLAEAS